MIDPIYPHDPDRCPRDTQADLNLRTDRHAINVGF